MAKPESGTKLIASNKKAFHDYHILDKFEAGVVLTGTEVKSLRDGKANLKDSYVLVRNGEAILFNTHISPYTHGNRENHDPVRNRKLLLHKREIEKLAAEVVQKGLTVVPLQMYFKSGRVKVEIGVAKGKQLHDKRSTEKEKEGKRDVEAAMKFGNRK
jgi:SsrA-binding protein